MEGIKTDLVGGLRSVWKHKAVSALAIASLGLAIGGNTAVFSLISAMFLRPLPFVEPERLVFVSDPSPGNTLGIHVDSSANFLDLRDQAVSFERLIAFRGLSLGLEGDGEPESVSLMAVTEGFFKTLRWIPILGQAPSKADFDSGAGPVAVLSNYYWNDRFGADPDIIGKDLDLSGELYRVVGVLPSGTEFLTPTLQIFSPLAIDSAAAQRKGGGLSLFGRLADGVTLEQAGLEMGALAQGLKEAHPEDNRGYVLSVTSMRDRMIAPQNRQLMAALQVGLLFVLLIACANVANLLLAQGQRRKQELAVRSAMGAERGRLVVQLLTESLVLAGLALGFGVALAAASIRALTSTLSSGVPSSFAPRMEPRVLVFTIVVALLSGLVFGLLPALRASRINLSSVLGSEGRGGSGSKRWLAKGLVVGQVAMAMALLAGAAMLVESLRWLQFSSPGFDGKGLVTLPLQPPTSRYSGPEQLTRFYDDVLQRVEAVPGVEHAALVTSLPRSPFNPTRSYQIEGRSTDPDDASLNVIRIVTTSHYFETLGLAMLRGRSFGVDDREDSVLVTVVNRAFAAKNWPEGDPLGERLLIDGVTRTVVGVVPDVWQELLSGDRVGRAPVIYVPQAQASAKGMNLVVRTLGDEQDLHNALRAAVWEVDPRISIPVVRTFEEYVGQFFGTAGLGPMLGIFGGLALLLAAIGIYGVIGFSVDRRTREIGLRMALGADRKSILRLIGMDGVRLLAMSIAVGGPVVFLVGLGTKAALGGLAPVDPLVGLPRLLILVLVVLAATYIPARRAAKLAPIEALRQD